MDLISSEGQKLKLYTILVVLTHGMFSVVHDVHTSIAYNQDDALADTKQKYNQTTTSEFSYEVKKVEPIDEFLKFLRQNISLDAPPVLIKVPRFRSKDAAQFVDKLIEAVPAIIEGDETTQKILTYGLKKVRELYADSKIS